MKVSGPTNDDTDNRRACPRRAADPCVGVVDGKAFPVLDWSHGGVLLTGDERLFTLGESKNIVLKFRLPDQIIDVRHTGRVVRKGRDKFALRFDPLPRAVTRQLQRIINAGASA